MKFTNRTAMNQPLLSLFISLTAKSLMVAGGSLIGNGKPILGLILFMVGSLIIDMYFDLKESK